MFFLFSLINHGQKVVEENKNTKQREINVSQYSDEARWARSFVSCPKCGSRHYDLYVLDMKGKFRCKKCDTTFEKEND
jgi:transposase-like protein|tara:strand:+ start:159 stop:392 length:234 start_codon:yes stop_codon:yes gene_type:complete